jgi:putative ABC transport system permease protein
MALGASRSAVLTMVAGCGFKLTAAGLAIGLLMAMILTRAMTTFLYGVRAFDPLTFVAVPSFVVAVATIACIVPAWKAACVDPVGALRD